MLETVLGGDCCCLFNNRNQAPTTDLDTLHLFGSRFITSKGRKKKKKRVFPRLTSTTTNTALFHNFFGEQISLTLWDAQ